MPCREATLSLGQSLQQAVGQGTQVVLAVITLAVLVVAVTAILRVLEFLGKAIRVGSIIRVVLGVVVALALLEQPLRVAT
jgi:hypothetical protein